MMIDTVQVITDNLSLLQDSLQIIVGNGTIGPLRISLEEDYGRILPLINVIFPIAVVIISASSIWFNNRNNKATLVEMARQHKASLNKDLDFNMRTVKPILKLLFEGIKEEDSFVYKGTLVNSGLGPALIDYIKYQYEGKDYRGMILLFESEKSLLKNTMNLVDCLFTEYGESSVRENDSLVLFRISISNDSYNSHNERFIDFFKSIDLMYKYESLYSENFEESYPILNPNMRSYSMES